MVYFSDTLPSKSPILIIMYYLEPMPETYKLIVKCFWKVENTNCRGSLEGNFKEIHHKFEANDTVQNVHENSSRASKTIQKFSRCVAREFFHY